MPGPDRARPARPTPRCPGRVRRPRLPLLLGLLPLLAGAAAPADPATARDAWEQAERLRQGAFAERVQALRRVRALARPHDPLHLRAVRAEARALRGARRVHGAAALEALAARLLPAHDPERAPPLVAAARALRAEGDDEAARPLLEEAAGLARREAPEVADEALDLLVEDADERRDVAALGALAARLERERARPSSVIRALDALGCLHLARGARPQAQACLARLREAFLGAGAAGPREAALATKAWLDAGLRKALAR